MRKRWGPLALVFSLTVAACGDDPSGPDLEAQLVGTWDVRSINGNVLPWTITEPFQGLQCTSTFHFSSVTFRADGTFTESGRISGSCTGGEGTFDESFAEDGTYSVDGNQVTTQFTGESPQTATIAISGSTLTTTQVDNGQTSVVVAIRR